MKVPFVGVPISVGFNRGLLHIWPTSVKLSHSFDICTAWVWHCHCLSCLSLDDTMQRVCLEMQKINKQPLKHIIINKLDTKVNVVTKNHSDIWHISQPFKRKSGTCAFDSQNCSGKASQNVTNHQIDLKISVNLVLQNKCQD